MVGCLVLAFALCQPGGYGYAQQYYAQGYAQQGYYQQQVVYAQPQPVYVVQQPVYVQQPIYQPPYYGGSYGGAYPFAGSGISVAVGPRGGVRVGVGR